MAKYSKWIKYGTYKQQGGATAMERINEGVSDATAEGYDEFRITGREGGEGGTLTLWARKETS